MNIVKLYGGLGNQMFQYAFGAVMVRNGITVAYDNSWGLKEHAPPRPYSLDKFRTHLITVTANAGLQIIHESDLYRYNSEYQKMDHHYFFGYWQNRKYMEYILPVLKGEFRVKEDYYTDEYIDWKCQILSYPNAIAMHIRRGDYLTKGHHLLPIEYYDSALYDLRSKNIDGPVFIFSDDVVWCKEYFKGERYHFINIVDYLTLDLMRSCPHKITANSTFSWWAAVLGEKENSFTYAPLRWRLDDSEEGVIVEEKFIPDNWIRL